MAIVINGSGTITGLSVGGLPDGIVDTDTLASGTVTNYGLKDRTWYDTKTSLSTIGSTDWHSLPSLEVTTGTPASTNSKFLILVQLCYDLNPEDGNSGNDNDEGFGTRILRTPSGGSGVAVHEAGTKYETYGKNNAGSQFNLVASKSIFYVDEPSSSAALTYNVQCAGWKAANEVLISPDNNISDLLVMELLA